MYELHRHGSLAHGRRAALGRTGTYVAGGEDAGHARLEEVVGVRSGTREDEAVLVAGDGIPEPLGAGHSPKEKEQEREWQTLAGPERDRV